MSNAANILARIQEEGRQEAEAVWQEHREKIDVIKAQADVEADKRVQQVKKTAELEAKERKRRSLAVADLDARKRALSARQEIIDEVFTKTLSDLATLEEDKYRAWVMQTVLEAAETGEEKLLVNSKDKPLYEKWLSDLNKSLVSGGKRGSLTLSGDAGNFTGGFILVGQYMEKNCTFETLLRQLREETEADVAAILFG